MTKSGCNGPTISPRTVSQRMTSPANGATVSGTITVSANAADDIGVVGVQFFGDGASLGAEDATAPYSISFNTTGASNGLHTLTAVARDAGEWQRASELHQESLALWRTLSDRIRAMSWLWPLAATAIGS